MTIRVAINGFGRIGRLTFRAIVEKNSEDIEVVAVNDLASLDSVIHLLKYDSLHGKFTEEIQKDEGFFLVNNKKVSFFSEKNPEKLPWKELNIDIVIESTGRFTNKADAKLHLNAGSKKVLISAPSSDPDITVVYGVNHKDIKNTDQIISNGSCTTNCLAPIAYLLEKNLGIISGYMTTVHSVTGDQKTIDTFHSDFRRARNASLSMIPTSTGAAKAVGKVLPSLIGKLDGSAIRVPTANVSLIDFCFVSEKETYSDEINTIIKNSTMNIFKGIVEAVDEHLVSCDFNHNPHSSIVDLSETKVINNNFCRVLSWYDNEWGFSNRLIDVVCSIFSSR